jgi:hypothetical protein
MDALFSSLNFIASGGGILFVGALATVIVLFWDWRVALIGLFLVQLLLAALMVRVHGIPVQWAMVQTLVIGLCAIMLALSAMQVRLGQGGRQSGNWFFRGLILALLIAGWRILDLRAPLPLVNPQIIQLLGWLALMALLMLSLGDSPLFGAVALLLWCGVTHSLAVIFAPIPELIVGIGLAEIVLGLTCSYLILAERLPRSKTRPVLTDVVFPAADQGVHSAPLPKRTNGSPVSEKADLPVVPAATPLKPFPSVEKPEPSNPRGTL